MKENRFIRTRAETFKALLRQPCDHIPYQTRQNEHMRRVIDALPLSPAAKAWLWEGDFALERLEPRPAVDRFRPYFGDLPPDCEFTYFGVGRQAQKSNEGWHAGWTTFHPLAAVDTVEGLRNFPFPDVEKSRVDIGLEERVAAHKAEGFVVIGQMSQTILETSYEMRGIPELMMDFYERPDYVRYLFERIARERLFQARRFAEAGVDVLRIGDDIASQENLIISLPMYRDFIKPLHRAIIAAARAVKPDIHVLYHSDGNLEPLLNDLIDVGVTAINPVQPECMNVRQIKADYGERLVLWGCMPVQSTFEHGTGDDLRRHLAFLQHEIAASGGLVIDFVNFLDSPNSLRNLGAFFECYANSWKID
ncbi:MAG: uroporphyrinogen decarboxylase family protein [Opitutaceae bacterium]|jgi:uroporphyrinogen decarboxylase